jgi:hypothetical protein
MRLGTANIGGDFLGIETDGFAAIRDGEVVGLVLFVGPGTLGKSLGILRIQGNRPGEAGDRPVVFFAGERLLSLLKIVVAGAGSEPPCRRPGTSPPSKSSPTRVG